MSSQFDHQRGNESFQLDKPKIKLPVCLSRSSEEWRPSIAFFLQFFFNLGNIRKNDSWASS